MSPSPLMQQRPVNSCYSLSHIAVDEARPTTYGLGGPGTGCHEPAARFVEADALRHRGVIEDRKLVDTARLMVAHNGEALDVLLRRLRVRRLGEDQDLSFN